MIEAGRAIIRTLCRGQIQVATQSSCHACAERLLSSTLVDEAAPSVKEITAEVDAVSTAAGEPPLLPPQVSKAVSAWPAF